MTVNSTVNSTVKSIVDLMIKSPLVAHLLRTRWLTCVISLVAVLSVTGGSPFEIHGQEQAIKNSTRKIRIRPNALAAKAGSAVNWSADYKSAVVESRRRGKPIFWYVPTIAGTFMDRKKEIDQYMMAGYFSWPSVISVLNEHFVPLKAVPALGQQKKFGLEVYKFVEPGFLILDQQQQPVFTMDRITTQHPTWFQSVLRHHNTGIGEYRPDERVARSWQAFRTDKNKVQPPEWNTGATPEETAVLAEQTMIAAMAAFYRGQHNDAQKIWASLAKAAPHHPLGWKAAAEAQGIGPIVRGFEVHVDLPARVFGGEGAVGSAAPPATYTQAQLWRRSVDFLLTMQNEEGGYVDSDYDFGGTDSLPNVHVAVTSLVGLALIEARNRLDEEARSPIDKAIEGAFRFVTNKSNVNRIDRDEILWADAYRVRFIAAVGRALNQDVSQPLQNAVLALESIQSKRGGWYHEYENAFVTATALTALYEGKRAGAEVNLGKIERGLKALASERFDNGAYPYSSGRRRQGRSGTQTAIEASAGRMPICELGLYYWEKSDDAKLTAAIERSLEFQKHLSSALKYDDHTSTLAYGGFFFWYDMRSRTEAIAALETSPQQESWKKRQREIIMGLPEIDGCFVDSHELGRCYGTAMALLSLSKVEN